jgi:hypothetical protein
MTSAGLLRRTVVVCVIAAVAAAVIGTLTGHPGQGIGVAAGLLLGSMNGYLLQGLMARGTPFVAASLLRILFFSSLVLMAALIFRNNAWTIALGIGCAQLAMVGVGLRQGVRA